MKKIALIMAGGKGERFWPRSREDKPKQFLSFSSDGKTLIQLTVERILPLINVSDVFVVTNKRYYSLIHSQLPMLPPENILCEPIGRNTAPCIGLAAAIIEKRYKQEDVLMLTLPSDHMIVDNDAFGATLECAFKEAEQHGTLVTIGIVPTRAETGYGYICFDSENEIQQVYSVKRFVEKPDIETAKKYVESGIFLWNSGMFVWKLSTIISELKLLLPNIWDRLTRISNAIGSEQYDDILNKEYSSLSPISIDYGVMEKAKSIRVIKGNFGWDDMGSWLAVERFYGYDKDMNTIRGKAIMKNCHHVILDGKKRFVACAGLDHTIIVDTDDVLLICDSRHTDEIKSILEEIRNRDWTEYL